MKKLFYFITLLIFIVSVSPLPVDAAVGGLCNVAAEDYCDDTGTTCDPATGRCIAVTTTSSGSGGINIGVIKPYADSIKNLINNVLVPVLMAVAFIVFLWGVFKYFIWNKESESEKMEGRKYAMWGIIGFVIILSLWGLVNILREALNLFGNAPPPPKL